MQAVLVLIALVVIFGVSKLSGFIAAVVGGIVVLLVGLALYEYMKMKDMSPDDRAAYLARQKAAEVARTLGNINLQLVCPHCQTKGQVRQKSVTVATTTTGTVGGILKTNTSSVTKQAATQHHCDNCGTTWSV